MPGSNSSLDDHQLLQDNIKMVERLTIVDENPDFTSDVGGSDRKNLIFDELQFEDDEEEEEDGMSTTGGQVKGNFSELISYEYLQQSNTYFFMCRPTIFASHLMKHESYVGFKSHLLMACL